MSNYCDLKTLKNIYFAYIHSHISYCVSLYGSTKKVNMDKVLIQQKRAIGIMLKLKFDDSAKEHFKSLNIFTVYGQYIFESILAAKNENFKIDRVNSNVRPHSYNTRRKAEFVQRHRLKFFEKKPSYMGNKFLKYIPKSIKMENGLGFKRLLKEYIISKAFYSIEEISTSI